VDPKKVREALLAKFRQVCTERVNTILENFSAVVSKPDNAELIDRLMREVHTLKGELRIMGFADGGTVVHAIENVLKELRDGAFSEASGFQDVLTDGLDEISRNLKLISEDIPCPTWEDRHCRIRASQCSRHLRAHPPK